MPTKKKPVLINEGKTKQIFENPEDETSVIIHSKDDITAGDGEKRDIIEGKGVLATTTTCNVFRFLNECGVKTAFRNQISASDFIADKCKMIDLEIVVRREGHGSHLKRNPHHEKGVLFPKLRVEFYLKTSGKTWRDEEIPADDPYIEFLWNSDGVIDGMNLYRPDKPIASQKPFKNVTGFPFDWKQDVLQKMEERARHIFLILEHAWFLQGRRLVDFKIEFGFNQLRKLVLADVIDNDSWRLVSHGEYQDKQVYRDGGDLNEVTEKYTRVAAATTSFRLPRQRIILWSGSKDDVNRSDDNSPWSQVIKEFMHSTDCELVYHVRSAHKQPVQAFNELQDLARGAGTYGDVCANTVIIAFVGMSNGLGPMLAANTHIPVITCSPSVPDNPEDVWSSLRMPSNVPVMSVLSPKNAVLAAVHILANRSPRVYALVRGRIEERMELSA